MKNYEVLCFDSKHNNIENEDLSNKFKEFINMHLDESFDEIELGEHNCLKSFIPIFDSEGYLDKYYVVIGSDEIDYCLDIMVGDKTIVQKSFSKDTLDLIFECGKFTVEDTEYKIIEKSFDIDCGIIKCKCEVIRTKSTK